MKGIQMGKNQDIYYKVASEFGLNTNDIYKVWERYSMDKKEGRGTTDEIIEDLKTEFQETKPELFDFFIAFGLAVLSEEMGR